MSGGPLEGCRQPGQLRDAHPWAADYAYEQGEAPASALAVRSRAAVPGASGRLPTPRYPALATVCVLLLTLLAPARPVSAHPRVLATDPPTNGRVASGPQEIRIQFDERLARGGARVQVYDRERRPLPVRAAEVSALEPTILRARLEPAAAGAYTVVWQALSAVDGHTLRGAFAFVVGPGATDIPPAQPLAPNPWEVWLRRILSAAAGWIHLSGLIAGGGILLFWLVINPRARKAATRGGAGSEAEEAGCELARAVGGVQRLLFLSLMAGVVRVGLEVLDLAGSARDLLADPGTVRAYLSTRSGQGAVDRGLVLVASLAFLRGWERGAPTRWPLWLVAAIQAVSLWTVSLGSHGAAAGGTLLPVILDWLHLLAATVWAGGLVALWHLGRFPLARGRAALLAMMARFTPWAAAAVLTLLVTGIYAITVHAPEWWRLPASGYGRILLAKLTLVGAMVVLGARNSLAAHPAWTVHLGRLAPFVHRWTRGIPGGPGTPASQARRGIAGEAVTAIAVLGLAALLSRTPPPKAALPPPPPPLNLAGEAGDLRVTLTVTSPLGWFGPSRFRFQLQGRDGPPQGVTRVTLHLGMPEMVMPVRPVAAEPIGPGEYEAEAYLSMLGRWQAQVAIRQGEREGVRVWFDFGVGEFGPTADILSLGHAQADLGFHWSTVFLMAMPYVIVGSLGGWLVYMYRRAQRQRR